MAAEHVPNLLKLYRDKQEALKDTLNISNVMDIPRVEKIVVNIGEGAAAQNAKLLESVAADLAQITGQKPIIRKAKRSIAGFKLRAGMPIGCSVTLRGNRMYEFLERLIHLAIPRIRDFRGYSPKAFDGRGNYTLGIKEQIVFPEIDYDKVDRIRGLSVTIVTTAKTDIRGRALLDLFSFPFRK